MAEVRAIKHILKTLELIKVQLTGITNDTCIIEIKACLTLLSVEWYCFLYLEKTLEGEFDEAKLELVEKVERCIFELKLNLIKWIKEYEENNANQRKPESEMCLPHLYVPKFSGKYSEFPSFRKFFEESIHGNTEISKVHKLQYLKGLLEGEAFSFLSLLSVIETNYDEVWSTFKTRYDKPKYEFHFLVKQFMEQPSLNQGCSKSLRHLSDESDGIIRGLKKLGEHAEARDPWLVYILVNKLDSDSKEAWAHETAETDFPTLNDFFKFINKRSDALEILDSMERAKTNSPKMTM